MILAQPAFAPLFHASIASFLAFHYLNRNATQPHRSFLIANYPIDIHFLPSWRLDHPEIYIDSAPVFENFYSLWCTHRISFVYTLLHVPFHWPPRHHLTTPWWRPTIVLSSTAQIAQYCNVYHLFDPFDPSRIMQFFQLREVLFIRSGNVSVLEKKDPCIILDQYSYAFILYSVKLQAVVICYYKIYLRNPIQHRTIRQKVLFSNAQCNEKSNKTPDNASRTPIHFQTVCRKLLSKSAPCVENSYPSLQNASVCFSQRHTMRRGVLVSSIKCFKSPYSTSHHNTVIVICRLHWDFLFFCSPIRWDHILATMCPATSIRLQKISQS